MTRRPGFADVAGDATRLVIPIRGGTSLVIGLEPTSLPHTPGDWELVRQAASFLGSCLAQGAPALSQHDPRSDERRLRPASFRQALAMDDRLDVYALGTMRAERHGVPVRNWGGPKAGTRQAEGIFAFLFDRGQRGAHKDEIIELIWPDVALERADLAFHRTLGGLRRTLSPPGPLGDAITFRNQRYHLNTELVRWSDVQEFEEQLEAAGAIGDPEAARSHLEKARRLYRGDFLDDCPFYGDSNIVEERRQLLRGRQTDVLIALADAQEQRGNRMAAAGFFREALAGNGNHCMPAEQGLLRLEHGRPHRTASSAFLQPPRTDLPMGRAIVYPDEVTVAG